MRRPAFTIKRMMLMVLCLGLGLHLSVAAWRAYREGLPHVHAAILDLTYGPGRVVAVRTRPFWPSFWRRSLGLSWGHQRSCFLGGDGLIETCELSNPEIRMPLGPNTYGAYETKEQSELFWKLWRERQKPPDKQEASELAAFLADPLPRCLLSSAATRLTVFCFSGVEALLTQARKPGSPASPAVRDAKGLLRRDGQASVLPR